MGVCAPLIRGVSHRHAPRSSQGLLQRCWTYMQLTALPLFWIATCNKGCFSFVFGFLAWFVLCLWDLIWDVSQVQLWIRSSARKLESCINNRRWRAYSLPHSWTATCNKNLCPFPTTRVDLPLIWEDLWAQSLSMSKVCIHAYCLKVRYLSFVLLLATKVHTFIDLQSCPLPYLGYLSNTELPKVKQLSVTVSLHTRYH